jgi:cysteine sulfinate desulfinase/cysteine desulfurase-like protein
MGVDNETAQSTIRFSIEKYTTKDDIDFTINKVEEVLTTLRPVKLK